MKITKRLTALLLALMMIFGTLAAAAEGIDLGDITWDDWQQIVEDAKNELNTPVINPGGTNINTPEFPYENKLTEGRYLAKIDANLTDGTVEMTTSDLVTVASANAAQWQIRVGEELWVNVGGVSNTLVVNYAMLANSLKQIRQADNTDVVLTFNVTTAVLPENDTPTLANIAREGEGNTNPGVHAVNTTYNIVINYVFENDEIVSDPYTANIAEGSSFIVTVTFPTVQGYLPYIGETQQNSIKLNYTNVSEAVTINVVYKPTNVNYTVIHYQQNVDNDQYTEVARETKQGLTGSQVPEVAKTYEGFYNLLYEKPAIAADGSTVIEVYYDRYYYLMNFDMDGGYGTDPIYARYGANIGEVKKPTKAGYSFEGWAETKGGTTAVTLPTTMDAYEDGSKTYYAIWEVGDPVNYTIVYWKENADDNGYSFWGQKSETAYVGTVVDGADTIPASISGDERAYFTYNAARTEKGVTVAGDGSTVVNVYYYRNTYTIYFTGINGTCAIEEHTHGTNCNSFLDCIKEEHVHGEDCDRELVCELGEHTHGADCLDVVCVEEEHKAHTDECLICTKEEHTAHTSGCCSKEEHEHTSECYTLFWVSCGKEVHAHGDGNCNCTKEIHTHSEAAGCYRDAIYEHDSSCYGLTCGKAEHKHAEPGCYKYNCGGEVHEHTAECYRPCTKLEHTHTATCDSNSTSNVIYVVTAKYQQSIADVWPTADKFTNITLRGWTIDGIANELVSKRVTMTSDMCDTSDGLVYAKAGTGGSTQTLYYMFESHDQTSPENGYERKLYKGKYYDKSETYSQVVNSGSSQWGLKKIDGMESVERENADYDGYYKSVFLYYNRIRYTLTFYNVSMDVKKVANIMFEQPLKDYKDTDNNLLREYEPPYPTTLEPNAYEFAGWYTTPECYAGTEFDFNTATMPNGNLTLYAKWAPVTHTVKFYLTKSSTEVYKPATAETEANFTIPHGGNIAEEYVKNHLEKSAMNEAKPNGDYTFVMWYYYEDGVKKPFDPTMQIRKDLTLYGEWGSNTLKEYTVQYVLKDDHSVKVADDLTGSGLAGTTKTFDAKGGTDLYAAYQEGYFPTVQSQSLLLDIAKETLTITFEYVPMPAVPYTVRYVTLEKPDGEYKEVTIWVNDGIENGKIKYVEKTAYELKEDKVVRDNRKAVVTETFEPISGYMPDAYQKRLVVVTEPENGDNTINFIYTKDTERAYYKITHYIQNTDGTTWTEHASSQVIGDIDTRYTASPMTIPGYTYDHIEYVVNEEKVTDVTAEGAKLTVNGLEINLYYVRNEYPYEFKFLEQGTDKVLADSTTGNARYEAQVTENAKTIPGYKLVGDENQAITIAIEDPANVAKINVKIFYYQEETIEIKYQVVGPDGCGTLNSYLDSNVKVFSGPVNGSTPTAGDGFKFVGWYTDEACTEAVDATWVDANNKITPAKTEKITVNGKEEDAYKEATYYAKFEWDITSLTIKKEGSDVQKNESFIFNVTDGDTKIQVVINGKNSVTINGLKVGTTYTVTEVTSWSNRYGSTTPETQSIILDADANKNVVTVTNSNRNNQWLHDEDYHKNSFNK